MTAIVGMLCQDGVVIGADSAITHVGSQGSFTIKRHGAKKIEFLGNVIVAGTGHTGFHQRFCHVVETHLLPRLRVRKPGNEITVCRDLAGEAIKDFNATTSKSQYGSIVGFPVGQSQVLCEYDVPSGFQPDVKTKQNWFCSMGSSQAISDSLLQFFADVFWRDDGPPKLQGGVLAVTWTLDHVVAVNPGGVGGDVQIAVLERRKRAGNVDWRPRMLTQDDLSEHRQWIGDAKERLREQMDRPYPQPTPPPSPPA